MKEIYKLLKLICLLFSIILGFLIIQGNIELVQGKSFESMYDYEIIAWVLMIFIDILYIGAAIDYIINKYKKYKQFILKVFNNKYLFIIFYMIALISIWSGKLILILMIYLITLCIIIRNNIYLHNKNKHTTK